MWWTFFIIFFLVSVVSSTLLYFSLRRINQYENLLIEFQKIVSFSTERMKLVDENGTFESDDEVGFFFEELKDIQTLLDDIFEIDTNQEKKNAKKEK